jgi:quercetin dioxygenase-like cupin family protein
MESRRTFLELAAAALLPPGARSPAASQAAQNDQPLGVIARHALTGPLEGHEIVLTRSAMRHFPGSSTPVHRHPGVVLAYVLEGRVRFAINNEPEQLVDTGGTFFEPLGAVHTTSGSAGAGENTRILVFEVRPKEQA